MSNTKFTKGPWVNDDLNISCGKIMDIAIVIGYDPDKTGFNICNECTSNAELIAAAPEMYKMLSDFKDFAVRQGWYHVLINDAEKLLAKARGES
jgi:hypothetical protein